MKTTITVHASMTPPGQELTRRDLDVRDRKFGLAEIGYHYVIQRNGKIEAGRAINGASVHDDIHLARRSISVCLIGGAEESGAPANNFTEEQQRSLRELIDDMPGVAVIQELLSATPALSSDMVRRWYHKPRGD